MIDPGVMKDERGDKKQTTIGLVYRQHSNAAADALGCIDEVAARRRGLAVYTRSDNSYQSKTLWAPRRESTRCN